MKKSIPVEKNKEYIVDIIDNGSEGEGIARIDNFAIFIPGAIKNEKIKILIVKVLSSYAYGKIIEIIKPSEHRDEADCECYKRCGGCNLRHITYQKTLEIKENTVQSLVNKTLDNKIKVEPIIGMGVPYNYRNKAQYPVGVNKQNEPVFGVYANRTHEIIPIKNCKIQDEISEEIAQYVIEFFKDNKIKVYNEESRKGVLRHIVVKKGKITDQVMCILVLNEMNFKNEEVLYEGLKKKFPNIKTIVKNINNKNTNVILGNENIVVYGDGYIFDELGEFTFKISPMSFYQINPIQTEVLYNNVIELAELNKDDILYDLYCGIGTIGIFASKHVKKVYGIEIVEQAIVDAKENAKINNIDNIEFFAGDVEKIFDDLLKKSDKIDVIIVDPPRRGLDNKTIENIKKVMPRKIVYVSCNPATLVRDINLLEDKYEVIKIQPVDMFPFTHHVECVVAMKLKENL